MEATMMEILIGVGVPGALGALLFKNNRLLGFIIMS